MSPVSCLHSFSGGGLHLGNYFEFNDTSSLDMGLHVAKRVKKRIPQKRVTTYSIPGRSSDLHQWDGAYENYEIVYECFFAPDTGKQLADRAHDIAEWLHNAPFESRLEDSYDDDVYRLGSYIGGAEIEDIMGAVGLVKITFDVAAPAYLKSGETALTITNGGLLNNPTARESLPLIELVGSVSGLVKIGDYSLTIVFPGMDTHTLLVDCDIREAWEVVDGVEVYSNTVVATKKFPRIAPGTNKIEITGGIESVRVYPRWWKL